MSSTHQKTKLCWNCEGTVSRNEQHCPFCGVYIQRDEDEDLTIVEESKPQEHVLPPPYNTQEQIQSEAIPEPPYLPEESNVSQSIDEQTVSSAVTTSAQGWQAIILPLSLLLGGSLFFLFGLFLLLFSRGGTLTLQWDSSYWLFYLILSAPLLLLGWKYLSQVETEDEI